MDVRERIEKLLGDERVVLFMKGDRTQPQCGFSATAIRVLEDYDVEYQTVDVLSDEALREGIKAYANWPTIPQLYVDGTFIGGSDIIVEMNQADELSRALGASRFATPTPEITVTERAIETIRALYEGDGEPSLRLSVGANFRYELYAGQPGPGDIVVSFQGLTLSMDRPSARLSDGLRIDYVEQGTRRGFKIENPNEPPAVASLAPLELKRWFDAQAPFELFDVRTKEEHAIARLPGSRLLDAEGLRYLEALKPDARIVFVCHHGVRSLAAAEHARGMGFRDVHNVVGGIDAWSREVDPSVPRY